PSGQGGWTMHRRLAGSLLLFFGWFAPAALAQPGWRPAAGPLDAPPPPQAVAPVQIAQVPAVSLGRPVQGTTGINPVARPETVNPAARQATQQPLAALGPPRAGTVVRAQRDEPAFPAGKPVSGWVSLGPPTAARPRHSATPHPP